MGDALEVSHLINNDDDASPSYSSLNHRPGSVARRQRALKEEGVGQAAHLIRDAVVGHQDAPYEGYYDPYRNEHNKLRNIISVICGRLVVQLRGAVVFANWILFVLSFIEPPFWCRDASDLQIALDRDDSSFFGDSNNRNNEYGDCRVILSAHGTTADNETNQQYYPNSNAMWLTISQSQHIELACLAFTFLYLIVKFADDGFAPRLFFYRGHKRWRHSAQFILLGSLFICNLAGGTKFDPFFRMLILGTFLRNFQRELWTFLNIIPEMLYILAILAIIVVFYAWFGVVIYYDSPQGQSSFPNLIEGVWTLWICITTANYPDVMMPSYNEHRLMALYWISFMVVSFFYCMNLFLAVTVNKYDESIADRTKSRNELSKKLLSEAFTLLDHNNDDSISRESVMRVMIILNHDIPEIRRLSDDEKSIMFAFLDRDGSNSISLDEFLDFGNVLLLKLAKQSDYATLVETHLPFIYMSGWYRKLCKFVQSKGFEHAIDVILVGNAITIAVQDYPLLAGHDITQDPHYTDGYIDTIWETMETLFTVIYVLECMLKIAVNGWKRYSESARNMFDFSITVMAVLATAYVYYPNAYNNSRLVQFVVMARVLRLGRLLFTISAFQMFGAISADIIPAASSVFLVLLFIQYFFASLGMVLYGGLITRDPVNPISQTLLQAGDFVDNSYWANNFNDMFSGMNVLFNLLVVNNWTECEIGFEYVTGRKWMVRMFFFGYHLLGVIGISNVITSFIINAFFQQLSTIEQRKGWEEQIEGEAFIRGEMAVFNSSMVTGTTTGVKEDYYARIQPKHRDVEVDERSALRALFTQTSSSRDDS